MDENAELAEVLNRKTAKEEMQARDREARDSLCAGDGHEDSTSDQETIGGSNGYRGAAGVDSLTETDMQLIVLAEEVARLEGDLQEDRAKLAAMAEAAAADEEELERLRSLVAETWKVRASAAAASRFGLCQTCRPSLQHLQRLSTHSRHTIMQ